MLLSHLLARSQSASNPAPNTSRDNTEIVGLTADSRSVKAGYLFAALPGTGQHGINFVEEAISRGAVAILTEQEFAPPPSAATTAWIQDANPSQRLAKCAAEFYAPLPSQILGVTGTDGKSSIAFLAQALIEKVATTHKTTNPLRAGYIGTLGLLPDFKLFTKTPKLTTPDAVTLAQHLNALHRQGYDCVLLETSSHGLAQHRPDGLTFRAACFTGLGRDHLEYHKTTEEYFSAKQRLFTELLTPDGVAIFCAGRKGSNAIEQTLKETQQKIRCISYGLAADPKHSYAITSFQHQPEGAEVNFSLLGREHRCTLPLFTPFQAENLLAACLMACQALDGVAVSELLTLAKTLPSVPGRMERFKKNPASEIFVDYAHAPQAVEASLKALRSRLDSLNASANTSNASANTSANASTSTSTKSTARLLVVLGAGGNRDSGKRPAMGKAAAKYANTIFVTDDNPRNEDANTIRESVIAGAKTQAAPTSEIVNVAKGRQTAIENAISTLEAGDILAILGKGHETTQEVKGEFLSFDDRKVVRTLLGITNADSTDTDSTDRDSTDINPTDEDSKAGKGNS